MVNKIKFVVIMWIIMFKVIESMCEGFSGI